MTTQEITPIEYFVDQNLCNSGLKTPENFIEKYNLKAKDRHIEVKMLRQELMYRLRDKGKGLCLETIGKMFNKDHSTVIHACNVIENLKNNRDQFYLYLLQKYGNELDTLNYA